MNKQTFNDFKNEYENLESQDYSQLFDLVRRIVRDLMGKSRPGILLGLEDLGIGSRGYVGGYHRVGTNEIYLNRNVLQIMREDTPKEHFKAYLFHLLLHEYIHSVGIHNENDTRELTRRISLNIFDKKHPVSKIAIFGLNALFPYSFDEGFFNPEEHTPKNVEFVQLNHYDSRLTYI
ncbi:MAG: hypothetical protein ACXAB2_03795 [Candidatus Hodarchaeales archaeon]